MSLSISDLKKTAFFSDCPAEALKPLAQRCERSQHKPGDILKHYLNGNRCVYLIESGSFRIECESELPIRNKNKRYLICFRSEKHQLLGEFDLAEGTPDIIPDAHCIWDSTVIAIPREELKAVLEKHTPLYKKLFKSISSKLISDRNHTEAIQLNDTEKHCPCLAQSLCCIANDLGMIPSDIGNIPRIKGNIKLLELGAYFSEITEKHIRKKMILLKDLGLISFNQNGYIGIPNIELLKEYVKTLPADV